MNPSAMQILPSPINEIPAVREGSPAAGRPGKLPEGLWRGGVKPGSPPDARGDAPFSRILAEQAAEPLRKDAEEETAAAGPALAETIEPASSEDAKPAAREEIAVSLLPAMPPPPPIQPDRPPATNPEGQGEIPVDAEVPLPAKGVPRDAEVPLPSGTKMNGKIFPESPAVTRMPVRGDEPGGGSAAEKPIAGTSARTPAFAPRRDGEGAVEESGEADSSVVASSTPRPVVRPVGRQNGGSAPAAGPETAEEPPASKTPPVRLKGASGNREPAKNPHPAAAGEGAVPADGGGMAAPEKKDHPGRMPSRNGERSAGSPSGPAGGTAEGGHSAVEANQRIPSAAGRENAASVAGDGLTAPGKKDPSIRMHPENGQRSAGPVSRPAGGTGESGKSAADSNRQTLFSPVAGGETRWPLRSVRQGRLQPALDSKASKADLPATKIRATGAREMPRTESGSAPPAAVKRPENRSGLEAPGKAAGSDAPTLRDGVEQTFKPGAEKAGSGSGGEGQGVLTVGKASSPSIGTASESLRDPSAVPKQASNFWAAPAEKKGADGGRVRIVLSPDHLGTLDMDVRVRKEAVEILMSVQREDSLQTLRGHAAELRTALSDQGLRMESLSVQTSGRDFQSSGGFSGGYGGPYDGRNTNGSSGRGSGAGRRDGESGAGARQPAGKAPPRITMDGISVFA